MFVLIFHYCSHVIHTVTFTFAISVGKEFLTGFELVLDRLRHLVQVDAQLNGNGPDIEDQQLDALYSKL